MVTCVIRIVYTTFAAATAGEPDANGNLRFDAVKGSGSFKNNKESWLTLKRTTGPIYPKQVKAVYWVGEIRKDIVFKRR